MRFWALSHREDAAVSHKRWRIESRRHRGFGFPEILRDEHEHEDEETVLVASRVAIPANTFRETNPARDYNFDG